MAIMQPTYLPWMGYFALMDAVDEFIILDRVQFARRSWQQRNRIKTPQGPLMLTVPVLSKGQRDQSIAEARIDTTRGFDQSHIRSIELNYAKALFFPDLSARLFGIFNTGHERLCGLLMDLMGELRQMLGIDTPLTFASDLPGAGAKADLLANLCVARGATHYVSPPGSRDYLESSQALDAAGVSLSYFDYEHPVHPQLHGEFLSHLSVIDLLFNTGPDALSILRSGIRT